MAVQQRAEIHSASEGKKRKDVNMFDCGEWTARMFPKYVIANTENTRDRNTESLIRFYLPIVKGQIHW